MNKSSTIVIVLITVLSTALLVGHLFDVRWAGGTGYETHAVATAKDGTRYQRGESIFAPEQDIREIQFGNASIWMDQNTQITLLDGRSDQESIRVDQGRIYVEGDIAIQTREVIAHLSGITSFVHYSWVDMIDIIPIDGSALVVTNDQEKLMTTPYKMYTLPPYTQTPFEFDPTTSAATAFYEAVL